MRILSLLPAATQTLEALGLHAALVDGSPDGAKADVVFAPPDSGLPATSHVPMRNPCALADIFANIQTIGEATNTAPQAAALVQTLRDHLDAIQNQLAKAAHRPWLSALGGLNPPRSPGLWVPEQIALAGGQPALGQAGAPAQDLEWDDVIHSQPEMIVVMPCGATLAQAAAHIRASAHRPEWDEFPATHLNQIYAVDSAYFCVPGPRVVIGVEILAGLLHPHLCRHPLETEARRLTLDVQYG